VALVEATRKLTYWGAADLESYVSYGASPRGSINLIHGARAMALLHGRRYVLPSDVISPRARRPPPSAGPELLGPGRRDHRRHIIDAS
jgi:MoxR-like ATPase